MLIGFKRKGSGSIVSIQPERIALIWNEEAGGTLIDVAGIDGSPIPVDEPYASVVARVNEALAGYRVRIEGKSTEETLAEHGSLIA